MARDIECSYCGETFQYNKRYNKKYCNKACKQMAYRSRKAENLEAEAKNEIFAITTLYKREIEKYKEEIEDLKADIKQRKIRDEIPEKVFPHKKETKASKGK